MLHLQCLSGYLWFHITSFQWDALGISHHIFQHFKLKGLLWLRHVNDNERGCWVSLDEQSQLTELVTWRDGRWYYHQRWYYQRWQKILSSMSTIVWVKISKFFCNPRVAHAFLKTNLCLLSWLTRDMSQEVERKSRWVWGNSWEVHCVRCTANVQAALTCEETCVRCTAIALPPSFQSKVLLGVWQIKSKCYLSLVSGWNSDTFVPLQKSKKLHEGR